MHHGGELYASAGRYGDKAKGRCPARAVKGLTNGRIRQRRAGAGPGSCGRPDAGYLKATGKVDVDEGALRAAVSYDRSPRVEHLAIWVHERMDQAHPHGKAKFLEDPLNQSKKSGPEKVALAIRKELG